MLSFFGLKLRNFVKYLNNAKFQTYNIIGDIETGDYCMKAENMRFGEFIRLKRKKDARKLRLKDVATQMGISVSLLSDIESGRRNPFEPEQIDWFAQEFDLTQEEKELMYDLAAKELRSVPYDIEDTLMYSVSGEMARKALRMTEAGLITEKDWRSFLDAMEEKQTQKNN